MNTFDFTAARRNMIDSQIRTSDVSDERLLHVLSRVPRETFFPEEHRMLAYVDAWIPMGAGRSAMPPMLAARLLMALGLRAEDRVLEVGTGSGYLTACLANLVRHVVSVESDPGLSGAAAERLKSAQWMNVSLEVGDPALGSPRHAPYDAILVTASLPEITKTLLDQLAPGGRLVAILGNDALMSATRIVRAPDGSHVSERLFETDAPPLPGHAARPQFVF